MTEQKKREPLPDLFEAGLQALQTLDTGCKFINAKKSFITIPMPPGYTKKEIQDHYKAERKYNLNVAQPW